MNTELKSAIEVLIKHLSEDKAEESYYYAWQANIAMAFKDEYDKFIREGGIPEVVLRPYEVHEIANNAAKNFLDNLCMPAVAEISSNH